MYNVHTMTTTIVKLLPSLARAISISELSSRMPASVWSPHSFAVSFQYAQEMSETVVQGAVRYGICGLRILLALEMPNIKTLITTLVMIGSIKVVVVIFGS